MNLRTSTPKAERHYWVNGDHVLLDDVTRYGLHRKHIVRPGGVPDVDAWRLAFPQARIQLYQDQAGAWHLWLYWKESN